MYNTTVSVQPNTPQCAPLKNSKVRETVVGARLWVGFAIPWIQTLPRSGTNNSGQPCVFLQGVLLQGSYTPTGVGSHEYVVSMA